MQVSWKRILSVAIPTSMALLAGLWCGRELTRPHLAIQQAAHYHHLVDIEEAILRGDTNSALTTIRALRMSSERTSHEK